MKFPFLSRNSRQSPRTAKLRPSIEPLEDRIAPATLVNPTTVTFQDKNGDAVTVTISRSLFTPANVAKIFTFDTGSVSGDNSALQTLQLLDIHKLGHAASGMDVSITATPVNSSPGIVNVGYINSSGIDLGNVTVTGDLGRIYAGDFTLSSPGLKSLTVGSLGAQGLTTQAAGGDLLSKISGPVNSITVNGDLDGAIGIGGGAKGLLGSLTVTGNINGGSADFSGSVRTQGGITSVLVDGSIIGGGGASSGVIGSSRDITSVVVHGSVTGAGGSFSGAILSTKALPSVEIDGDLSGGLGASSGQVGSSTNIGTVTIGGSIFGGGGSFSGAVLATGAINSVTVTNGLIGGAGTESGQIGAGKTIGTVTIGSDFPAQPGLARPQEVSGPTQGILAGSGPGSGIIFAQGNITTVSINGSVFGPDIDTGLRHAISGGIGAISAGGIYSNGSIGTVTIFDTLSDGATIHAHQSIQSVSVNMVTFNQLPFTGLGPFDTVTEPGFGQGIADSSILADLGSIGSIVAGGSGFNTAYAITDANIVAGGSIDSLQAIGANTSVDSIIASTIIAGGSINSIIATSDDGTAIAQSNFHAGASIGTIQALSFGGGEFATGDGILASTFRAGAGIGSISATSSDSADSDAAGIDSGAFDAGLSIGPVNATGSILGSVFVAGIDLGPAFASTGTGLFDNTNATAIGFGSSTSHIAAHIGAITLTNPANVTALIQQSTFLAGVHGAGTDKTFGTKDDLVPVGSSIGAITSPDGLDTDFFESGSIGATTSGAITSTTYIATDPAVTAAGIGPITVIESGPILNLIAHPKGPSTQEIILNPIAGISGSTFISNAGLGAVNVTLNGSLGTGVNGGIINSTFNINHLITSITVNDNASGPFGANYGIYSTTFNGGIEGNGGMGDINVTLTGDTSGGTSAAIANSQFDATMCYCMNGNFGSISAENDDTGSGAAGILDTTFRAYGNIGPISAIMGSGDPTAAAVVGSTFSAFGSIGDINVYGSVLADSNPSRFLAGFDIGSALSFNTVDLSAKSIALQGGQSVGAVTITGYFKGSDIAASINPGAGYVFGDSTFTAVATNDTNIGKGGSIGIVNIGTAVTNVSNPFTFDRQASHGIEAATFATAIPNVDDSNPNVNAFGFNNDIPAILSVDGSTGDVRITDLVQLS